MNYNFPEHESIDGMYMFEGAICCGLHPSSIAISDGALDLSYTVGANTVVRSYALERSDGKITAFTNPDGTRTEVLHNG